MKGPLREQRAYVLLQVMFVPDGVAPFPLMHQRSDVIVVGLASIHFEIAPDGKIAACKPIEQRGLMIASQMCASPPTRHFEAALPGVTEPRGATFLVSTTVVAAK